MKKHIITGLLLCSLLIAFTACGTGAAGGDDQSGDTPKEYEELALHCVKQVQEMEGDAHDIELYPGLAVYVSTDDTGTGKTLTLVPYMCDGVEWNAIFADGEYVMDVYDGAPEDGSAEHVDYSAILNSIKHPGENGYEVYSIDPDKIMRQL